VPKIPASVRKEIVRKLLTSPRRRALWERFGGAIEEFLVKGVKPGPAVVNVVTGEVSPAQRGMIKPKRAYLVGSFPTAKPKPSDIDIMVEWGPKGLYEEFPLISSLKEFGIKKGEGVHVVSSRIEEDVIAEAKFKYGKDYSKTRILGLLGALGGGAAMALTPEEAEAGPFKHIGKIVRRARPTRGAISRTAEGLRGKALFNKTVDRVVKGRGFL